MAISRYSRMERGVDDKEPGEVLVSNSFEHSGAKYGRGPAFKWVTARQRLAMDVSPPEPLRTVHDEVWRSPQATIYMDANISLPQGGMEHNHIAFELYDPRTGKGFRLWRNFKMDLDGNGELGPVRALGPFTESEMSALHRGVDASTQRAEEVPPIADPQQQAMATQVFNFLYNSFGFSEFGMLPDPANSEPIDDFLKGGASTWGRFQRLVQLCDKTVQREGFSTDFSGLSEVSTQPAIGHKGPEMLTHHADQIRHDRPDPNVIDGRVIRREQPPQQRRRVV
ncbi:MAG: hypothetical protein ABIH11_00860 [Candidatus Altiarchaeota archaeon]